MQLDCVAAIERRESPNTVPSLDRRASDSIKCILMDRLRELRRSRAMTQAEAASWFGVSQPRISHLARHRANRFTVDTLINMLAHAGIRVSLTYETRLNDRIAGETTMSSRGREE